MLQVELARKIHFSSGHFYANPAWSDERNQQEFGSCYSPHGHGHNYILEVFLSGPIDAESGMILNLRDVDALLKAVVEPLDHHHLNHDVPFFKDHIPTTENIALYCADEVQKRLPSGVKMTRIRLHECDDLWVEIANL